MSADGRFVVFQSLATDLLPGSEDDNGAYDMYLRDRMTGAVELLSVDASGSASGDGQSLFAILSPDGRFAIFVSGASDLVPGFAFGGVDRSDLFARDRMRGTTVLVSASVSGAAIGANKESRPKAVTSDGIVLFTSRATDLVPGFVDGNPSESDGDLFVRDLAAGGTTLVSVNAAGTASGDHASGASSVISADGRFVAFASDASDLVAPGLDTNGATDVFVRDLQAGTTELVSVDQSGTASANGASGGPVIGTVVMTPDARYILFGSGATDLVAGFVDGNGPLKSDLYLRDRSNRTTTLISIDCTGSRGGDQSSGNGALEGFTITPDGRFIAFTSSATDLVEGERDENGQPDVYLRDVQAGTTSLVSSTRTDSTTTGNFMSLVDAERSQSISSDGRFVVFSSEASDLGADPIGRFSVNLFLRDVAAGTTTLISAADDGPSADRPVTALSMSSDGRIIAFSTDADNLLPPSQETFNNVYVYRNEATEVTPTPTPTATVEPPTPTPTRELPKLVGDCSGDGRVTLDELIESVDISLGSVDIRDCPASDPNDDGRVGIDELVRAVNAAIGAEVEKHE